MKIKTTIFLLLLVLAVGGYVWFVDRFKPSTAEMQQVEKRVLKDFRPELITRILIDRQIRENETGKVMRLVRYELEKETLGWKLVKPVNFPVNTPLVRQILDDLKKVDQHRKVSGEEYENINRDATGLNAPDIIATFETPQTSVVLRVGSQVPLGWEYYAELQGKRQAYFIPNEMHDILCFETDSSEKDVRRRRVFDVVPEYVNAVQFVCDGKEIDVRKGKDILSWYVSAPLADRADDKLMGELVKKLSKVDVEAYIEQPKEKIDLKYSVSLVQRESSQRLQISEPFEFVNEFDETNRYCYARRAEYGQFFTLRPDILDIFSADVDHYRAKTLFAPGVFDDVIDVIIEKDGRKTELFLDKQKNRWDVLTMLTTKLKDELAIEDYAFLWMDMPVARFASPEEGLRFPESAHWNGRHYLILGNIPDHVGLNDSRSHAVHSYGTACKLGGQSLCCSNYSRLGSAVVHLAPVSPESRDGGNSDYSSLFLAAHGHNKRGKYIVETVQVGIDDRIPLLVGKGYKCVVGADSRVADNAPQRPLFFP